MAVASELAGAEYLRQIVSLYCLQEILRADLVHGGDSATVSQHKFWSLVMDIHAYK